MSFKFQVRAKKTPHQKQKELEEKRRKRDELETEKVYEDFVKDFGYEEPRETVQTVKIDSSSRKKVQRQNVFGSDQDESDEDETNDKAREESLKGKVNDSGDIEVPGRPGKIRRMDILLENLKRDQAEREQQMKEEVNDPKQRDPLDHADQGSTNLFVGNVAPDIDESMLLREFGRFGPIGSVKIMWPRDEEQRLRGRNTGFVAFMHRKDAEKAKSVLDGALLHDMELAVGWGKSVPLPSVPIWPPATGLGQAIATEMAPESTRERIHDGPPPKEEITGIGPDVVVSTPKDERMRFIIDALAYYVVQDGFTFEQLVMENECNNPEFKFLYDNSSPDHIYYRWRVFSLANGDTLKSWRVDPFLMFSRSARWIPPPMTGVVAAKATEAKQVKYAKGNVPLSEAARKRIEIMLETLSSERRTIADAMMFVIDHAESCQEVSNILVQPLLSGQIPIQAIVAHLYLLSDILHNTSAPVRNASQFRSTLQDAMPDIFEVLNTCYRSAPSRISQESLRRNILRVLRVWRGWYIFSDDFLNGLQAAFLRGGGAINPSGALDTKDDSIARIDPEYKKKLEKMKPEELDNYCKQQGVSRSGGTQEKILRLLEVHDYLKGI